MNNLVIPIGGSSSRFPNMRPKWMLTHPSGNMMITEAIKGIDISKFEKIYIIGLKEHEEKYSYINALTEEFEEVLSLNKNKLEFVLLNERTNNQPETVYKGLKQANVTKGSIFIKDSDNFFKLNTENIVNKNIVAIADLHDFRNIEPGNKSFILFGNNNSVANIVEKKIISDSFCVGGYGFEDVNAYYKAYEKIEKYEDIYISHIIYEMINNNHSFWSEKVEDYLDWGTLEKWKQFLSEYKTIFIDIDGVLVQNSSKHFEPKWCTTKVIDENAEYIKELYNTNKVYIVLTTSRYEKFRDCTKKQLEDSGIKFHQLVMGLPHCKRVLINDFAKTNPYPSAISINLERNGNNLRSLMEDFV